MSFLPIIFVLHERPRIFVEVKVCVRLARGVMGQTAEEAETLKNSEKNHVLT